MARKVSASRRGTKPASGHRSKGKPAAKHKAAKFVYYFGEGKADGNGKMKPLLGGKGANLAEMTRIGLPVRPGFTITTETCREYMRLDDFPFGLLEETERHLKKLEREMGRKLGDPDDPLLVSVRSGANFSLAGL